MSTQDHLATLVADINWAVLGWELWGVLLAGAMHEWCFGLSLHRGRKYDPK